MKQLLSSTNLCYIKITWLLWYLGPVLVNDVQTPLKSNRIGFLSPRRCAMFWNLWKIHFYDFSQFLNRREKIFFFNPNLLKFLFVNIFFDNFFFHLLRIIRIAFWTSRKKSWSWTKFFVEFWSSMVILWYIFYEF